MRWLPCVLGQHAWVESTTSFMTLLTAPSTNLPHESSLLMSLSPLTPYSICSLEGATVSNEKGCMLHQPAKGASASQMR